MAKESNAFEFAKEIFKINEYATVASDGIIAGDFEGFLDTGSYSLNALISGTIYGGFPLGKVTALAGKSKVGKTFFVLSSMKLFQDSDPKAIVVLFESESALTKATLENFGIDVSRVLVLPVETIERFRHQCMKILINYNDQPKEDRRKMMIVLDSLGMLSSEKEMGDIAEGKDTRDMTKSQLIKGAFRTLTLKLGKLGIPFILTNHVYTTQNLFAQTVQGGGSGPEYAASTIVFISKQKDKIGTDVVGNIIHCKLDKGRLTKENSLADTAINYETGLSRWHGMLDFALEAGIWKKSGQRIELQSQELVFPKAINASPEKYFTEDVMKLIDEYVGRKYLYGNAQREEINGTSIGAADNYDDNDNDQDGE